MEINANRQGPIDIVQKAQREYAAKRVEDMFNRLTAAGESGDEGAIQSAMKAHDDAVNELHRVHNNDTAAISATQAELARRRSAGKTN